jgi:predicted CopG family antitoxin
MATKTITLELDAYEKLRRAKRAPRESFSAVVRRAVWQEEPLTAAALLAQLTEQMRTATGLISEDVLDRLDKAQRKPRVSASKW